MKDKITVARIKRYGLNFEISVDPDKALEFKENRASLQEALLAENIFTDAKKGLIAKDEDLQKAFQTTDVDEIAKMIIKEGEIQLTAEHRAKERDEFKRKLVYEIHKHAVDPKTGLPHPLTRIEAALDESKVHIDLNKGLEEQFANIVSKIRIVLPISIEKKVLVLLIPAEFVGKIYQFIKNNSKLLKEEWVSDGSWRIKTEIPAGFQREFVDKLNSVTKGNLTIENE